MLCGVMCLFFAATAVAGDFMDNGDGTVSDARTGLMWAKSATYYGSIPVPWSDATSQIASFSAGGKSGWRIPTLGELKQLLAGLSGGQHPFTDMGRFGGNVHWTTTKVRGHKAQEINALYFIDMGSGQVSPCSRDRAYAFIWPVRNGN